MKSFTLHSSIAPHLLGYHLSTASAAEKKKGRLTLAQWGDENIFNLAGNPPPSSFVKGTHLKGLFELWAGVEVGAQNFFRQKK